MRKGMRFQTKLMLTIGCTVAGTTLALILATQSKIRETYTRQFEREFDMLAQHLETERKDRSSESLEISETLAAHPYVAQLLSGEEDDVLAQEFWDVYLAKLRDDDSEGPDERLRRPGPGGRPPGGPDLFAKVGRIVVLRPDGEIVPIAHPKAPPSGRLRGKVPDSSRSGAKAALDEGHHEYNGEQRVLYLPVEGRDGKMAVQEMIATPVSDPNDKSHLGFFLRGTSAETEAERFLERYQEEFGVGTRMFDAIWIDGEIYTHTMPQDLAEGFSGVVANELANGHSERSRFTAEISGRPFLVYLHTLGKGSIVPAYEVVAFSLENLNRDLLSLRLIGTGIGATVLLIGLSAAYVLSRNLAAPLQELARGTDAIRKGDLDHRVNVRSHDEIGELAESFNEMAEELKQKARYRELLGKVSDDAVAQAIIEGSLELEPGGETKQVSVLFCDIRGFTAMTENMAPDSVIEFLNEHMSAMTEVVREHKGVVDKFVGDEIMAVFGSPKSYGNDAAHAAACAIEMIRRREQLNREGRRKIEMGIGIATGEAIAGCMGSPDRLNYTVLGSRVNLASRLASAADLMEIVVDENTRKAWKGDAEETGKLRLKGFSAPVAAFRLEVGDIALSGAES